MACLRSARSAASACRGKIRGSGRDRRGAPADRARGTVQPACRSRRRRRIRSARPRERLGPRRAAPRHRPRGAGPSQARARPPPTALRASVSPSRPSSLTSSAKTSRPARRIRQRSRKLPLSATSPIATRPNTTLSTSVRAAEAASSTSSRRRRRAPSKRICSWGSQSSRLPGPSAMSTAISVSGPSERYSFSAAWVVRTARAPSAMPTATDMRSPPAMPPPVLISTPSHAPAARGKRTR